MSQLSENAYSQFLLYFLLAKGLFAVFNEEIKEYCGFPFFPPLMF